MKRDFITELLPDLDKDVLDKIMAEHGKSMTAAQTEAADLKERLKTAQETLKSFDGVDVSDLKGQIAKLSGDLTAKDAEWQGKLSEMQFSGALEKAIMGAKAKNTKAVMALLDMDTLKASKNLDADIATALEAVKKDNDYLFDGGQLITTARSHGAPPSGLSGVEAAFYARNPALKTKAAALITKIRDVTFAGLTAEEQAEWLAGMKAVENYADWNRQNGNIATAKDTVKSLGYSAVLTPVPTATAGDVPMLDDVNALEGNLTALSNCGLTMPTGWEASKTWTAGGGPSYTDWNRWERNIALLEEMAVRISAAWYYSGDLYTGEV